MGDPMPRLRSVGVWGGGWWVALAPAHKAWPNQLGLTVSKWHDTRVKWTFSVCDSLSMCLVFLFFSLESQFTGPIQVGQSARAAVDLTDLGALQL